MNTEALPASSEDAAWASFKTPFSEKQLLEFCQDVERLFRINPYLEFSQWEQKGSNQYHFAGKNISTEPTVLEFTLDLTVESLEDGIRVNYAQGLKSSTTFKVEPSAEGSQLTITEDYGSIPEQERQERLNEVDRSLIKWANDIQMYIMQWQRWSKFPLWRWYMRRVWQPLKPTARRIVYMILWISVVEIALIALGGAIYWAEYT